MQCHSLLHRSYDMKHIFLINIFLLTGVSMSAAQMEFTGNAMSPVAITTDPSTGLDCLYVLQNTSGVVAAYRAQNASATVVWERFGSAGGAYAESVAVERNGAVTSCRLTSDDCGFIIQEDDRRYYFWITNYANHPMDLSAISISPESDCTTTYITPAASGGERIVYYTINGAPRELSRELSLTYSTLEYDEDTSQYHQVYKTDTYSYLTGNLRVDAPLCDTSFTLSGDRFQQAWKIGQTVETGWFTTQAVSAETTAEQTQRDNDNESSGDVTGLGGSAPVEITFSAAVTDAVRFTEWQFSKTSDFDILDLRFNQTDVTYTFRDYGTTYVRFMATDDSGQCEYFSQVYEVNIGESKLLCPNAFSPGSSEGVNDEWKVSYKSIVEFECHIFNRWGVKIASLTDPSQGWDGRYGGKIVPSGVYYYVIKARGSDGRKYNLSGDINIINYKQSVGTSVQE